MHESERTKETSSLMLLILHSGSDGYFSPQIIFWPNPS